MFLRSGKSIGISENMASDQNNEAVILQLRLAEIELERAKIDTERTKLDSELKEKQMQHELEMARLRIENPEANLNANVSLRSDNEMSINIENYVKAVKVLTMKVPSEPQGWNLYFSSLERAFRLKEVPETFKAEILVNLLAERVSPLLIKLEEDEITDYNLVKNLILREFQPTAGACLENFRNAKRRHNETHVQFVTRLMGTWEYYIKLRKVEDFKSLSNLIVSDKLFESLDKETSSHICIKQGQNWLQPRELAEESDLFFAARGKDFSILRTEKRIETRNFSGNNNQATSHNAQNIRNYSGNRQNFNTGCFNCHDKSHLKRDCPKLKSQSHAKSVKSNRVATEQEEVKTDRVIVAKVGVGGSLESHKKFKNDNVSNNKFLFSPLKRKQISVDGKLVKALCDSGSEIVLIRSDVLPAEERDNSAHIYLKGAFGDLRRAPMQYVKLGLPVDDQLSTAVVHREILCAIVDDLEEQMIIPPLAIELLETGAFDQANVNVVTSSEKVTCLADSSSSPVPDSPVGEHKESVVEVDEKEENYVLVGGQSQSDLFRREQENCPNLAFAWNQAKEGKGNYFIVNYLLFHKEKVLGETVSQLVVPMVRRKEILKLAHETVFGGHMGTKKTLARIRYSFFWEGLSKQCRQFCDACSNCQLRRRTKVSDRVPITPVVRPDLPFEIVSADLIGPLDPPSSAGHKYVLCVVDQHSRWAEAIPLKSLTAKATCDAFLHIFSRTGFPKIIACDNGTNFNANLTKEFEKRMGCSPRFSTPYHPESNGIVERFNATLKNALHHVIRTDKRDWHLQLPYLLWAFREIPHSTTGFPPFQLLYGRQPQGPLSILKSTWTGERGNAQLNSVPIYKYLADMKSRMERAAEEAKCFSEVEQAKMASRYNLRSRIRNFKVGDEVLLLSKDSTNKLYARWKGPGKIIKHIFPHSYIVQLRDGTSCHVHQNKIRHFIAQTNTLNVIFEGEEIFGDVETFPSELDKKPQFEAQLNEMQFSELNEKQKGELKNVLRGTSELFTSALKPASVNPHVIELLPGVERKKPHCYRVPEVYKNEVEKQIQELLDLGFIEPSKAEIAYPIVCVAKKDASMRMCIDFRALNSCTKVPAFPMKNAQELMFLAGQANWLSTMDLLKGYHQIPMEENSKPLTAFATHNAVYQFCTMPFGLVSAASTFQHSMNQALRNHQKYAQAYIDDVIIFSKSWEEHLDHIRKVCEELISLGFRARIDKCMFGKKKLKYLGHIIGSGKHAPDPDKLAAINELKRPVTKKDVRSVLGLMGFYRSYIPNFASLSLPLSELTKKRIPNVIPWDEKADIAFRQLKQKLCQATTLATPDLSKVFQIHADASNLAVAACLTQLDDQNNYKPIAFASQKLSNTQKNWAPIEQEAFAVLFGLKKFETWIFGTQVEIISDHNPLKFLALTTPKSPKLTRWALALQRWNLKLTHKPGAKHLAADAISRLERES